LQVVVCTFMPFLLAIVLSFLLLFTDSDYPFDFYKFFLLWCGFCKRPLDHRSLKLSPVVFCGKISGYLKRLSPICSFICTRQTSYMGFKRKTKTNVLDFPGM